MIICAGQIDSPPPCSSSIVSVAAITYALHEACNLSFTDSWLQFFLNRYVNVSAAATKTVVVINKYTMSSFASNLT